MVISSHSDIDETIIYKMIFIYNSIIDGWTVKKIENDKISFTKKSQQTIINSKDFIESFIKVPDDLYKIN